MWWAWSARTGLARPHLLRLLAGLDTAERGRVTLAPPSATVGLLRQEPDRRPGRPCASSWPGAPGWPTPRRKWTRPAEALGAGEDADDRYSVALERWLALGGADLDDRIDGVLAEVGLDSGVDVPITALSGGQAARAGLATLLASRYDVLLLDEPTNDLDLDGLARLEAFVGALRSPAVIVSHDREFLARTVNRDRRAGPGPAEGRCLPGRLPGLPGRAGGGAPPCPQRRTSSTPAR